MDTSIKYLKDENGNIISPATSVDSIFTQGGGNLIDYIYPIGSIYMSVNDVDPSILFGGTWERIKDKFLLCSGDTYTLGSEGGEATHTLTISEMPSHTHTQNAHNHTQNPHLHGVTASGSWNSGATGRLKYEESNSTHWMSSCMSSATATNNAATATNQNTGGGASHNNMPPYLTVNVWMRVNPTQ